ncbi:hypothetical protein EZS27_028635 [termite gut metagenome]|uniref:Uncharacterized protein n=1 Tax=termite gut metagenome TaxID=433724 RepID=A0A5J4QLG6_9ZZZZ
MILTDYYKFEHLPDTKSKMRMDCTASTKSYQEFEILRNKKEELFVYLGNVPDTFGGSVHRKADKAITKTKNISSVFVPDIESGFAYGDVKGTQDAILIITNKDYTPIDIFVARGQRNNRIQIFNLFSDGELDSEIAELKGKAVTEIVTEKKE